MNLLVLFSLLVGSGMTAPLHPTETFDTPLLRTLSDLKIADKTEDRDLQVIATLLFDNQLTFIKLLVGSAVIGLPVIYSLLAFCNIAPYLCPLPPPSLNRNRNLTVTVDPQINANLRRLTGSYPNLLMPFALGEQQANYFRLSKFYPPAMFAGNVAYPDYPTPAFAIVVPFLEKDKFVLAMRHNWMANYAHHPLANVHKVANAALDDVEDSLS